MLTGDKATGGADPRAQRWCLLSSNRLAARLPSDVTDRPHMDDLEPLPVTASSLGKLTATPSGAAIAASLEN